MKTDEKINWGLLHSYSTTSPQETSQNMLNIATQLTIEEKTAIEEDCELVRKASSALHIAYAVILNRNEFLKTLLDIGNGFLNSENIVEYKRDEWLFELSRKLLNLCASFRAFIEHQDTFFKRHYGRKACETQEWSYFLTATEEKNNQYALFYGLRNYVQHVDMPPLCLSFSSESAASVTLALTLKRDELLAPHAQWSDHVRKHLKSCEDTISVWDLIHGWDEAFLSILKKVREYRVNSARGAAERILSLRERYSIEDHGLIGISPIPNGLSDDGRLKLDINWIDEQDAKMVSDPSLS